MANGIRWAEALFDVPYSPFVIHSSNSRLAHSPGRRDPETGEAEDKLHAHWRLSVPTRTPADHAKLKECRERAAALVGSDPSCGPIVHPVRWPGSWHRKATPRLCSIVGGDPEYEIDLETTLADLRKATANRKAAAAGNGADHDWIKPPEWEELIKGLLSATDYHNAGIRLAMKLLVGGTKDAVAVSLIRGWMEASVGPRDERWPTRYDDIPQRSKRRAPRSAMAPTSELTPKLSPTSQSSSSPAAICPMLPSGSARSSLQAMCFYPTGRRPWKSYRTTLCLALLR